MGRYRKRAGLLIGATIIALPPYGDEPLGVALGAALAGGDLMDDTSSNQREKRRSGGGDNGVARWVGIIVIGSIVILAIQVGGLRAFVQH